MRRTELQTMVHCILKALVYQKQYANSTFMTEFFTLLGPELALPNFGPPSLQNSNALVVKFAAFFSWHIESLSHTHPNNAGQNWGLCAQKVDAYLQEFDTDIIRAMQSELDVIEEWLSSFLKVYLSDAIVANMTRSFRICNREFGIPVFDVADGNPDSSYCDLLDNPHFVCTAEYATILSNGIREFLHNPALHAFQWCLR